MADIAEIAARVARLEDEAAIRDLIHAVARGVDRYDGNLLAASIWPDAVIDMGGEKPMSGAAFAAAIRPPANPRPGRMHLVGNIRILLDGDTGRSESHIVSCQDVLADGVRQTRIRAGRYLDCFARREGEWRLASRQLIDEWGRIDPVANIPVQGRYLGRPAPDDASYSWSGD